VLNSKGFNLIELLVVIAIVAVLAGIGIPGFMGFVTKSRIDNQTKRVYADLMQARVMAMNKNMAHFVVFQYKGVTNQYAVVEDTDGDGSYDVPPTGDTQVLVRGGADIQPFTFSNQTIQNNVFDDNFLSHRVALNSRGVADNLGTVCIGRTLNIRPMHNCIVVNPTQTRMGRLDAVGANCDASHCL
jgi:prepilin-type N-terminal cleavage/methylation domain-containing protein